jgi:hypothetical protein
VNYSYLYNTYKRLITLKLASLVIASFLMCILFSAYAFSQEERPATISPFKSGNFIVGVRTAAYDIGHDVSEAWSGGFCGVFGERLKDELSDKGINNGKDIQVSYIPIGNNYLGKAWERYDGLRDNIIHVECGPNSLPSDHPPWARGIAFSKTPFHKSGIKLLIKKSLLDSIKGNNKSLSAVAAKAKISVAENTTTFSVLNNYSEYDVRPTDSRDDALDQLEKFEDYAYASDALIIKHLFSRGAEKSETAKGEVLSKERSAYKDNGYTIFPNNDSYLADESEEYIIAIKEGTAYADDLMQAVENTINSDSIKAESLKLKKAEIIPTITPSISPGINLPDRLMWIAVASIVLLLLWLIQSVLNRNKNTPRRTPESSVRVNVNPVIHTHTDVQSVSASKTASATIRGEELTEIADEIRTILESIHASTSSVKIAKNKAFTEGSDLHIRQPSVNQKMVKILEAGSIAALEKSISHPLAVFFIEGFKEMRNQSSNR